MKEWLKNLYDTLVCGFPSWESVKEWFIGDEPEWEGA